MKTNKGIVVEADRKYAIILLPGGQYRKVRTAGKYYEPGDLYENNLTPMLKYAIAAVLLLTILAGRIDYNSVKAYARLEPDLELGVNRWGRVVSVEAKSEEGQQLMESVQIKNNKVEVAVEKISRQAMLEENTSSQEIRHNLKATAKDKKNKNLEKNIMKEMEKGLQKVDKKNDIKDKNKIKAKDTNKNKEKSDNRNGNELDKNVQETKTNKKSPAIEKSTSGITNFVPVINNQQEKLITQPKYQKFEASKKNDEQRLEQLEKEEIKEKNPPGQSKKNNSHKANNQSKKNKEK